MNRSSTIIGIPKERKILEARVSMTPSGVAEAISLGHKVLIESEAGKGSGFSNEDYISAGATVVDTLQEVWQQADLLVKVKEPAPVELSLLREDMILFNYLHLASAPNIAQALVDSNVTSIAYELVRTSDGRMPLLEPMSEIAGKLAVLNASYHLLSQNGGKGILFCGALGVVPAKVTIIGAGIAGRAACNMALGMGAEVTILDISASQLRMALIEASRLGAKPRTVYANRQSIYEATVSADIVIGAALIPGASAPKLVREEDVKQMSLGSVIVDISIDQGGCIETTKVTSLREPTYTHHGVIHYGVPNMPAQTPRTSTLALTAQTLPYIIKLANFGTSGIKDSPTLLRAVSTFKGKLTNKPTAEAVNIGYTDIEELLQEF